MNRWPDVPIALLRPRLHQHVAEDEGFEDREDVFAVSQHPVQHAVVHGIVLRQALPALQYVGWDVDILPQFLQRVTTQKETVEERCFLLRLGELELCSLHKLRNPPTILTRKNSDAPVKFFPDAPGGNTMINPLSSPHQCSCGSGGYRTSNSSTISGVTTELPCAANCKSCPI